MMLDPIQCFQRGWCLPEWSNGKIGWDEVDKALTCVDGRVPGINECLSFEIGVTRLLAFGLRIIAMQPWLMRVMEHIHKAWATSRRSFEVFPLEKFVTVLSYRLVCIELRATMTGCWIHINDWKINLYGRIFCNLPSEYLRVGYFWCK